MRSRSAIVRALAGTVIGVLFSALTAVAAAPGVPGNLTATVEGYRVTLTWDAPFGGTAPLGYLVEAALSPGGPTVAAFLVIQPTLQLNGIPDGVYYVRVRAGNAEGLSGFSNEAVVAVPGTSGTCTSPPDAPINVILEVAGHVVKLRWDHAPTGCLATAYVVQAGSAPGLSDLAIFNVGAARTLTVPAAPGTYYARIVALNAFGASPPSFERKVTVRPVPIDLSGVWFGTSDYINAPFTMTLTDRGETVGGTYQDQKDFGGVSGRVADNQIEIDVNFGDTGFRMFGTIEGPNRIRGTLRVPVLGGRVFTFEMTR